jgi:hypothetical protein
MTTMVGWIWEAPLWFWAFLNVVLASFKIGVEWTRVNPAPMGRIKILRATSSVLIATSVKLENTVAAVEAVWLAHACHAALDSTRQHKTAHSPVSCARRVPLQLREGAVHVAIALPLHPPICLAQYFAVVIQDSQGQETRPVRAYLALLAHTSPNLAATHAQDVLNI